MQYRTYLNHRINLEFSGVFNQPSFPSSSGASASPPILLCDNSIPLDIWIHQRSPLVGQSTTLPGDTSRPPPQQTLIHKVPQETRMLHKAALKGSLWMPMTGKTVAAE
ncbi:hypothetical protein D1P53_000432 [Cryptococcus gattii VGV]|nr:hypothetical protein D1P53_000432 [Cryptococcus gattii VGV]